MTVESIVVRDETTDEKLDITKTMGELNARGVKIINTKVADDSVSCREDSSLIFIRNSFKFICRMV